MTVRDEESPETDLCVVLIEAAIELRQKAQLSTYEIGRRLDISEDEVIQFEDGTRRMYFPDYYRHCAACGVSMDEGELGWMFRAREYFLTGYRIWDLPKSDSNVTRRLLNWPKIRDGINEIQMKLARAEDEAERRHGEGGILPFKRPKKAL